MPYQRLPARAVAMATRCHSPVISVQGTRKSPPGPRLQTLSNNRSYPVCYRRNVRVAWAVLIFADQADRAQTTACEAVAFGAVRSCICRRPQRLLVAGGQSVALWDHACGVVTRRSKHGREDCPGPATGCRAAHARSIHGCHALARAAAPRREHGADCAGRRRELPYARAAGPKLLPVRATCFRRRCCRCRPSRDFQGG
jgi:hypothetical protein